MRRILAALLFAVQFSVTVSATYAATGRTAAQFLNLPTDSRSAALADSFTAMSGDIGCIFFNPSGLATMEEAQLTAGYMDYSVLFGEASEGMYALSWAAGAPVDLGLTDLPLGVIALGLQVMDQGSMIVTANDPTPIGEVDLGTNWALTLSYAQQFSDLSAGLNLKVIHQQLWTESDDAFAVDLGVQYSGLQYFIDRKDARVNDPDLGLRLGVVLQNLGTGIQMTDEYQTQELPRQLVFGASIDGCVRLRYFAPQLNPPVGLALFRFHLTGELVAYVDKLTETAEDRANPYFDKRKAGVGRYAFSRDNLEERLGAEVWFFDTLALRVGHLGTPDYLSDSKVVYGFGLRFPFSHLVALALPKQQELTAFDWLYRETDRQIFVEMDYARNQGLNIPGGGRPTTIGIRIGI